MAHSIFTDVTSSKVDCTQTGNASDAASAKLLASGFTPPLSGKDAEIKALRSANCELQARLNGYLVLRKCFMLIIYLISFNVAINRGHEYRLECCIHKNYKIYQNTMIAVVTCSMNMMHPIKTNV